VKTTLGASNKRGNFNQYKLTMSGAKNHSYKKGKARWGGGRNLL